MLGIILNSYRGNFRRYAFAIIALVMATVVSSLGLSGVRLMASIWSYPLVSGFGGQITIGHTGERGDTPLDKYSLISSAKVRAIVEELYPEAEITENLVVPAIYEGGQTDQLRGRSGGLDKWYLMPPLVAGAGLNKANPGDAVFTVRYYGPNPKQAVHSLSVRVGVCDLEGGREAWQLVGEQEQQLKVVGATGYPSPPGAMGPLDVVQKLTNTPADLVHVVGIGLPGLQAHVDDRVETLRARLDAEMPGLQAVTIDDMASGIYGLEELRKAAGIYTPVLLVIALQIVVATALAIVQSRKKELSMLRIIGFSTRQVWLLFAMETTLSGALACALGVVLAKVLAFAIFQSGAVSLLPFFLALGASTIVAAIIGIFAVSSSVPDVLRNA